MQPSGETLAELFRALPSEYQGSEPTTGQVEVNGVQHTLVKKTVSNNSQLHKETTLPNTNKRDIIRQVHERRILIRE